MIAEFTAHACAVQAIEDLNIVLIALADRAMEPTCSVELQRSLEPDAQDAARAMDTYCIVTDRSAVCYGGIVACVLSASTLTLRLSPEARAALGVEEYRIVLALTNEEQTTLRVGLVRLFADDPHAPEELNVQG